MKEASNFLYNKDLFPFYDDNPDLVCLTFDRKTDKLKLADSVNL